jgi:hypothetical protein
LHRWTRRKKRIENHSTLRQTEWEWHPETHPESGKAKKGEGREIAYVIAGSLNKLRK